MTCKEVAKLLYVSVSDIGNCVQTVKKKLGGRTVAACVIRAYSMGYLTGPDEEGRISPHSSFED